MLHATMYVHVGAGLASDVSFERRLIRPSWIAALGPNAQATSDPVIAGGGREMVFRKDRGGDSFQRQINALRQQLGSQDVDDIDEPAPGPGEPTVRDVYPVERTYDGPARYEPESYGYDAPVEVVNQGVSNEPPLPNVPVVDSHTTVVGPNATWKGEIVAQGSMHILGHFEGNIQIENDLYILDDAQVDATIAAGTVFVAGRYNGAINCSQRLEVLPSGRLRGEIYAPTLVVHDGAIINSTIRMTQSTSSEQPIPAAVHRRTQRGTA